MADKMLKITLIKSPIGAVPKHRRTVEAICSACFALNDKRSKRIGQVIPARYCYDLL